MSPLTHFLQAVVDAGVAWAAAVRRALRRSGAKAPPGADQPAGFPGDLRVTKDYASGHIRAEVWDGGAWLPLLALRLAWTATTEGASPRQITMRLRAGPVEVLAPPDRTAQGAAGNGR